MIRPSVRAALLAGVAAAAPASAAPASATVKVFLPRGEQVVAVDRPGPGDRRQAPIPGTSRWRM